MKVSNCCRALEHPYFVDRCLDCMEWAEFNYEEKENNDKVE